MVPAPWSKAGQCTDTPVISMDFRGCRHLEASETPLTLSLWAGGWLGWQMYVCVCCGVREGDTLRSASKGNVINFSLCLNHSETFLWLGKIIFYMNLKKFFNLVYFEAGLEKMTTWNTISTMFLLSSFAFLRPICRSNSSSISLSFSPMHYYPARYPALASFIQ